MKTIVISLVGSIAAVLGVIGLVIPILPGFLFLLVAAACFASVFPFLRNHMSRHPRMRRFFHRMDAGNHLDMFAQVRVAFWAGLEALTPQRKNR